MIDLGKMKEAIRRENLGGWLFSTLKNRDLLSLSILELDSAAQNTRPWYYVVFPREEPVRIVHAVESGILKNLPGSEKIYASREELSALLYNVVRPRLEGRPLACQYSAELPIVSFLDHGTVLLLEASDIRTVSSAPLLQRFRGVLGDEDVLSHTAAAGHLYDIVCAAWRHVRSAFSAAADVYEGGVRDLILREFASRGLETDHPPIVAAGANAGDPHYTASGRGALIGRDSVLQLDLWAREAKPGSVYADISWVLYTGERPPEEIRRNFEALVSVRDAVVAFIAGRMETGSPPSGAEVDREARVLLSDAGFAGALRHRTGHGIDREVHGSGVNLDSVEFPDHRLLLEGSCFSVEPGIYFAEYGLRTEIDVVIRGGRPVVTGGEPQRRLLTF